MDSEVWYDHETAQYKVRVDVSPKYPDLNKYKKSVIFCFDENDLNWVENGNLCPPIYISSLKK